MPTTTASERSAEVERSESRNDPVVPGFLMLFLSSPTWFTSGALAEDRTRRSSGETVRTPVRGTPAPFPRSGVRLTTFPLVMTALWGTAKPDTVAPAYGSLVVAAEERCSHGVRRRLGAVYGCCCKSSLAPPGAAQQSNAAASLSRGPRAATGGSAARGLDQLAGTGAETVTQPVDDTQVATPLLRCLVHVTPSLSLVCRGGACHCSSQRPKAGADSPVTGEAGATA